MSHQLDPMGVESQVNAAVEQAIAMLKMPHCDDACEANKTLSELHSKLASAQLTASDSQQDLTNAEKNYFVALKGDTEFESERNAELKKLAASSAKKEIGKLRKRLDILEAPINAAVSLESLTAQATNIHRTYEGVLKKNQAEVQDQETKVLIDRQRAASSNELRETFNRAINGWMKYAYFVVAAAFILRLTFTGAYRSRANIVKLGVVLLLPLTISRIARWAQQYSPFGDALTQRLRFLYENGLQN